MIGGYTAGSEEVRISVEDAERLQDEPSTDGLESVVNLLDADPFDIATEIE